MKKNEDKLNTEARLWDEERLAEYGLSEALTDWLRSAFIAGGNYGMSHGPMSCHEILKLSQIFCHNHCNKARRLCCDFYIEHGPDFSCPQLAQFQTDVRYVFNDGYVFSDDHVQTDNEEE